MAEQKPFPLQLRNLIFTKINVETIFEHEQSGGELKHTPKNSVQVDLVPDAHNLLSVQFNTIVNEEKDPQDPYFIEINCVAFFEFDGVSFEEIRRGAAITGHNTCYGAIREAVTWLTGRLPFGPLLLGISLFPKDGPPDNNAANL